MQLAHGQLGFMLTFDVRLLNCVMCQGKAEIGKADTHASLDSFRLQASVNCVDFTIVDLAGSKTDKGTLRCL